MLYIQFASIIILIYFSSSPVEVGSIECECLESHCPDEPTCLYGSFNDFCCCDFCYKGPGESCGGYTLYPSICMDGYRCKFPPEVTMIPDLAGICVPEDSPPGEGESCGGSWGNPFIECEEGLICDASPTTYDGPGVCVRYEPPERCIDYFNANCNGVSCDPLFCFEQPPECVCCPVCLE